MTRKTSLQLARELGVSPSYLSQVKNGKRPASDKLLSNPDVLKLLNIKRNVKRSVKRDTFDIYSFDSYNLRVLGNSLVVGQRTLDPPG